MLSSRRAPCSLRGYPVIRTIRKLLPFQEVRTQRRSGSMHQLRKAHPSDLSDDQWALIEPLIPVNFTGRPRKVDMREGLQRRPRTSTRSGLPVGHAAARLPGQEHRLRPLRPVARTTAPGSTCDGRPAGVRSAKPPGMSPEPRTACIDSQTVKGTEVGGERGTTAVSSGSSELP